MPSFRELMTINDPMPMVLGEKVRPKKAEPAPCPYAAFEKGKKMPAFEDEDSRRPPPPKWTSAGQRLAILEKLKQKPHMAPTSYVTYGDDLDGWIPHGGGPCPVGVVGKRVYIRQPGWESPNALSNWSWGHVTAYKLATPPEAPKKTLDPITAEEVLLVQQKRQRDGLPVEWDKVPVGSKVWVRDYEYEPWHAEAWSHFLDVMTYSYRTNSGYTFFAQCKLHIEGVAP